MSRPARHKASSIVWSNGWKKGMTGQKKILCIRLYLINSLVEFILFIELDMTESEYPEFDEAVRNTVSRVEMQQIKRDKGFVKSSRFRLESANQLARSSGSSPNIKK
jgi:hypothetical protein